MVQKEGDNFVLARRSHCWFMGKTSKTTFYYLTCSLRAWAIAHTVGTKCYSGFCFHHPLFWFWRGAVDVEINFLHISAHGCMRWLCRAVVFCLLYYLKTKKSHDLPATRQRINIFNAGSTTVKKVECTPTTSTTLHITMQCRFLTQKIKYCLYHSWKIKLLSLNFSAVSVSLCLQPVKHTRKTVLFLNSRLMWFILVWHCDMSA